MKPTITITHTKTDFTINVENTSYIFRIFQNFLKYIKLKRAAFI